MMPSDYLKDLIDHKERVAKYMGMAAGKLLERMIELGNILPYTLPDEQDDERLTLMFLIDVACKLKRDPYGAQFELSPLVKDIIENTLTYLALCRPGTPCEWIGFCIQDLFQRAAVHDHSKFSEEEFEAYNQAFPNLQKYAYGTPEFKAELAKIKPAVRHHLDTNDHHPEYFYPHGIDGMHLVQLIEMVCDWIAASERSQADIYAGLSINRKRFGIDDQLFEIIKNTVDVLKK